MRAAALLLPLLLLAAPPAAAQTVQREWRLLAVGLDTDPGLDAPALLARVERGLRRELPGLEPRLDVARWRSFPAPAALLGPVPAAARDQRDDALVRAALARADEAGLEPATYDVVFVLSPRFTGSYFGRAHIDWTDRRGRAARAALIQTAPGALIVDGVLRALERDAPPLAALLRALRAALVRLLDRPALAALAIEPTLAHELGHFFAPGDLDVKDGYQAPWLRHAEADDRNPEGHRVECVMFKGRDAAFYLRKLAATRGRLVVFCDPCRAKLGCPR